jgi:hypothetical protein
MTPSNARLCNCRLAGACLASREPCRHDYWPKTLKRCLHIAAHHPTSFLTVCRGAASPYRNMLPIEGATTRRDSGLFAFTMLLRCSLIRLSAFDIAKE